MFGVLGFLYCVMGSAKNNLPFKVIGVVLLGIVVVPTVAYRIILWRLQAQPEPPKGFRVSIRLGN